MMEEDIDIEEHDVLDNPRIRDIFPDLAKVKIELDSDDDEQPEQEDNYGIKIIEEYTTVPDEDGVEDTNDVNTNENIDSYPHNEVTEDVPHPVEGDYDNGNYILGNLDVIDVSNDFYDPSGEFGNVSVDSVEDKSDPSKIDAYPGNSGKSYPIHDIDSIVISDSDNVDDDVNDDGDDEADSDEVDLHDDDSLQSNSQRYKILRQLLTESDYTIPNKIILGSKPLSRTGKEYQPAIVLLEDWSEKLKQSGCFCEDCEILFETPNALDHHKMSTHSFLVAVSVNKALKSTAKCNFNFARKSTSNTNQRSVIAGSSGNSEMEKKYCHHCNLVFPDHTSLIKHLYEVLPIKKFSCTLCKIKFNTNAELANHNLTHRVIPKLVTNDSNPINIRPISSTPYQYKCKLCHEIFETYYGCAKHRKSKHPKEVNKSLFLKIKKKSKPDMAVIKKVVPENQAEVMVLKSTLFQCKSCKIHFLSGMRAVMHKVCNINSYFVCTLCSRRFRNEDKNLHKKQHELNSKFKVYLIVNDLYNRILCKCQNCNLHFEEKLFKGHFIKCDQIPSAECTTCNIVLPKSRLIEHTKKHYYLNMKPKDFIIVTYISLQNNLKRKHDFVSDTPVKKQKLEAIDKDGNGKIRLYYCQYCQCCLKSVKSYHLEQKCRVGHPTVVCFHCGLNFTRKSIVKHLKMHKFRKITVKDFEIVSLETHEVITPPIPKYHRCKKCKINFFRYAIYRNHICGEDYDTCDYCGESYFTADLNVHKLFHDYSQKEVTMIPELLKNYELINPIWNVLFHCNICNVLTDSYDKCVEHSQAHVNKQYVAEKSIKCYICNVKFFENCWSKHSDLHARKQISIEDFKVLVFDPKMLLTDSWLQMFESLPEKETNQIIDTSVYGDERGVKMRLVKQGRSEFTLYTCSNCSVAVEQASIAKHIHDICSNSEHVCDTCNIAFSEELSLIQHKDLHAKGIDKDEFRIVTFEIQRRKDEREKIYNLYKCRVCGACVAYRTSVIKHTCPKRGVTVYCKICDQSFVYQVMIKHDIRHQIYPDFKAENIKITLFCPKTKTILTKNVKPLNMVTQKKAINKELIVKNVDKNESKMKLYKCVKCKVCVFCEMRLPSHNCLSDKKTFNCKICKEIFPMNTIPRHRARHRNNPDFCSKNFKIINFEPKTNKTDIVIYDESESESKEANKKVESVKSEAMNGIFYYSVLRKSLANEKCTYYKCVDCGISVVRKSHLKHKCVPKKMKVYCNICKMSIFLKSQMKHKQKHAQNPHLRAENIEIIEFKKPTLRIKFESDVLHRSNYDNASSNHLIKLMKCEDCGICMIYNRTNEARHICANDNKKAICKICNEYFVCHRIRRHEELHTERNLTRRNFKIITFKSSNPLSSEITVKTENVESNHDENDEIRHNEIEDVNESNIEMDHDESESGNIQSEVKTEVGDEAGDQSKEIDIEDDDDDDNDMKLYKCANCKVCILLKGSIPKHLCNGNPLTFFCKICNQHFSNRMSEKHKLKHKKCKNLIASKIKVVKFKPIAQNPMPTKRYPFHKKSTAWQKGEIPKRKYYPKKRASETTSSKIWKCECGLHFTSEKSIRDHMEICTDELDISKENCSKCGLLFPTDILVSHLCKHHSKDTEIVVENVSKPVKTEPITEEKPQTPPIDNDIEPQTKDIKEIHQAQIKPDIYKCSECNVYFLNQNTCYKHVLRHEKLDPKSYIECKICGLQFTLLTLWAHMRVHHSRPFNLDKIMVQVYYPKEKGNKLKKELYCAGDRVQSLLVSSTND